MSNLHRPVRFLVNVSIGLFLLLQIGLSEASALGPEVKKLTSYAELSQWLIKLDQDPLFTISEAGKTAQDRSLWLIRVGHPNQKANWRVFLYAQQHGNEPAGKEALIQIARSISANHNLLPKGMELWLMPMVNPDGAELDQRRNSLGADINRDHMILNQLETQALHRSFQLIKPQLAIDCHEFARDSDDYREKGWLEWTEIMMDFASNPLLNQDLVLQGADLVKRMGKTMNKKGIHFQRYFVGGVPPNGEQRYSAPDMDGGLNGAAIYGGLSFIIEGGVYRYNNTDNHDLPRRVNNYTELLWSVLQDKKVRKKAGIIMNEAGHTELSDWLATNYFWAQSYPSRITIPVIDSVSLKTIEIEAPNFMTDLVIKKSVSVPQAYLIHAEYTSIFSELLKRHKIDFEIIEETKKLHLELCLLDTVESEFDDLYHRYGGRVITHTEPGRTIQVEPGSLLVRILPQNAKRVLALLEPTMLYGLYQYPKFRSTVGLDRYLPVRRVINLVPDKQ